MLELLQDEEGFLDPPQLLVWEFSTALPADGQRPQPVRRRLGRPAEGQWRRDDA